MPGLGTIINVAAIVLGGLLGLTCGKGLKKEAQDALCKVCGVSTLFLGIAGAMEGMLTLSGEGLTSGNGMLVIACLALGALAGNVLIFCVGVNLVWGKQLKVANMLPSVVFAVLATFL